VSGFKENSGRVVMEMIFCPNCNKLTGYKRTIGFGTFFAVLLTAGFWLLALPFYPKRCIACGLSKSESVPWHQTWRRPAVMLAGGLLVAILVYQFTKMPNGPPVVVGAPDHEKPASPPSTKGAGIPSEKPSALPSIQYESASSAVIAPRDNPQDHELHLAPNLFGHGAISDGRTYSVSVIVDYRGYLPHSTELFVQGRLVGFGMMGSVELVDELHADKRLLCYMTADEFDDVSHLYHIGETVQAFGEYAGQSDMLPVFNNCRVSSPTDHVVRPVEAASPAPPANEEPSKHDEGADDSRTASSASVTAQAPLPRLLQVDAGTRMMIHIVSISRQPDGSFTFRGTLLRPLALAGGDSLNQTTKLSGWGTSKGGQTTVFVTEINVLGTDYALRPVRDKSEKPGSGSAVELYPSKILEVFLASASIYEK
jgi:hypothetical protein